MNNFILGLDAILYSLNDFIINVLQYPLFWGFAIGFLVSTLVHGFLMSDDPRHISTILMNDPVISYQKIKDQEKQFAQNYLEFIKMAARIKIFFALIFILFLLIVILALVIF